MFVCLSVSNYDYTIGTLDVLQACDACADMGMTYSVIVQCTDCVVLPRLVLYTWLATPVAVCIGTPRRYTRLAWLANHNPNPTNPNRNPKC